MYMHVQVYMYMYIPPLFSWGHLGCEVDLWAVYKSALAIISTVHVQCTCTCVHEYSVHVYICVPNQTVHFKSTNYIYNAHVDCTYG